MHLPGADSGPFGMPTGAAASSLKCLTSTVRKLLPRQVYWVHDKAVHPDRCALYPDYKKKEYKTEEERVEAEAYHASYHYQQDFLLGFLPLMGVRVVHGPYEGDDTIWYLTEQLCQQNQASIICTADRDFTQLLSPFVSIYALDSHSAVTHEGWNGFSRWSPNQCVLAKAILGDNSDNIPSPCHGLGKVGLRKLLAKAAGPDLGSLCEAAKEEKAVKYKTLLNNNARQLIARNVTLTWLGLIGFNDPAETQVVEQAMAGTRRIQLQEVLKFLTDNQLFSIVNTFGYWSRAFEVLS